MWLGVIFSNCHLVRWKTHFSECIHQCSTFLGFVFHPILEKSYYMCFFVSYHLSCNVQSPRKEVNAALKKEAEYFGDVVILPFMDHYELVVLKTIAICEYGVSHICFVSFLVYCKCMWSFVMSMFLVLCNWSDIGHLHPAGPQLDCTIYYEIWWWHIYQGGCRIERNWGHCSE